MLGGLDWNHNYDIIIILYNFTLWACMSSRALKYIKYRVPRVSVFYIIIYVIVPKCPCLNHAVRIESVGNALYCMLLSFYTVANALYCY